MIKGIALIVKSPNKELANNLKKKGCKLSNWFFTTPEYNDKEVALFAYNYHYINHLDDIRFGYCNYESGLKLQNFGRIIDCKNNSLLFSSLITKIISLPNIDVTNFSEEKIIEILRISKFHDGEYYINTNK